MSLVEKLTNGVYSDGTGNGGKDLTGLSAMVAATGTYGGINSSLYTWWQSFVDSSSNAITLAEMRTLFNTPTVGGRDHPDLIVTTQAIFETYEGLLTNVADLAFMTTPSEGVKKMGDGGFQTLGFKGVPIVWDELCNSGYIYFLNTEHMKLVVHEDANFKVGEFIKPGDQDAKVSQILFMGNLTCDRRKSFSVGTGKS